MTNTTNWNGDVRLNKRSNQIISDPVKKESADLSITSKLLCRYCWMGWSDFETWQKHEDTHTGQRPFLCTKCGMTFREESTFKGHANYHSESIEPMQKTYPCGVCGDNLYTEEALSDHILDFHIDEWPLSCDFCTTRYTTRTYLAYHQDSFHNNGKNVACKVCGEKFGSKSLHKEHVSKHIDDKSSISTREQNESTQKSIFQSHTLEKDPNRDFPTPNVEVKKELDDIELDNPIQQIEMTDVWIKEEFDTNDGLTDPSKEYIKTEIIDESCVLIKEELEMADQTEQNPIENENATMAKSKDHCELVRMVVVAISNDDHCNSPVNNCMEGVNEQADCQTDQTTSLLETTDQTQKRYECKYCQKTFSRRTTLRDHKNVHSGEKPYHCNDCGKTFVYDSHYRSHLRVHANGGFNKSYQCDICGRKLHARNRIVEHMRLHSKERPFACDMCDSRFISAWRLTCHRKYIHKTGKPFTRYKCEYCDKTFSRYISVKEHEHIHTGEKLYLCNDCGKSFRYGTHFRTHLKVHANGGLKMPHKCHICCKNLSSKSTLIEHMRLHTNERPVTCDLCDIRVISSRHLYYHKRKVHGTNKVKEKGKRNVERRKMKLIMNHIPFTHFCVLCDRKYRSLNALNFHQRKHSENRKVACVECGVTFTREKYLKVHNKRIHFI